MEKVFCDTHGTMCMLKTGVKDGPNKGKSFYVCVDKKGCDFSKLTSISPSHCLHHDDSVVELQALTFNQQHHSYRLFYRCTTGKKANQKWCGNVPWSAPNEEKRNPLSDRQLQPTCQPPVRNPFKAPEKTVRDSEWKISQMCPKADVKERSQEGSTERNDPRASEENAGNVNCSEMYRGKQCPPWMKIKKKVSDDEQNSHQIEEMLVKQVKHKDSRKKEEMKKESSTNCLESEKMNKTSQGPNSDSLQKPAISETSTRGHIESNGKDSDSGDTQVSRVHEEVKISVSNKPSESAKTTEQHRKSEIQIPESVTQSFPQRQKATPSTSSDDDDDVQVVSVKAAPQKTPPASAVQKTLTSFPGFQPASKVKGQQGDPAGLRSLLTSELNKKKATLSVVNVSALPDKGERLKSQVKELEDALESLSLTGASEPETQDTRDSDDVSPGTSKVHPYSRPGGTILLPNPPALGPVNHQASGGSLGLQLSQSSTQKYGENPQIQTFYGGRMTENRLLAVKNATSEAIDHLHKSLETCPSPDDEARDPKGLKVTLLAHQKSALVWLFWREAQKPCGGILADDMGLGKTLTMISLIMAKKTNRKEEDEKKEENSLMWLSKNGSGLVVSNGTLIICPASLIHHWKMEIDRHVKRGRLTVYLYHGPTREKSATVLAGYDVVVTTYNLVSKEVPINKDEAEKPSEDTDDVPLKSAPLLRVSWARVILDEAHNIKNPKVQTSMAVCRLRACARWAMTGTPIQNNLLDMYSLLKFLRCSPFDEFKVWKSQVDNGSERGSERLNILTRTLLLRRTKDQVDSTGKPLVSLPDRTCEIHRLKLSEEEQAVYDVVFAQSRSTLQDYLKRHEGNDVKNRKSTSGSNPFERVAQEFGVSQSGAHVAESCSQQPPKASSTVHILSLLLRLRQCCCHLSLLKKTLDSSELQGDGIVLSLEEQLNALSLSSSPSPSCPDPKDSVSLNGNRFPSLLFEETSQSTKISAVVSELKSIREKSHDHKSVIVSQWTSMLHIVAVHLQRLDLTYSVIDGTVNPKRRMDLVEEFNTNPKGPQVMLLSLCAGGVGLNLVGGNHLFLMDMHWNPALEDQACDRIYRVGQSKDVTIHRFVCEGTVEDKISILQMKKKELAQNVLSGTGSTKTKLSLADLRIIFGV